MLRWIVSGLWAAAFAGAQAAPADCPARPSPSVPVMNPPDLVATGNMLKMTLTMRSREMAEFPLKICYAYDSPAGIVEAPTLRLSPGDVLDLTIVNRLSDVPGASGKHTPSAHDPCEGGVGGASATNLAFDGLPLAPICHAGDVIRTMIEAGDAPFTYRIRLPGDTPPGLHLYHPHSMGSAALQVESGAAGPLIVGGIEKIRPELARMPERILVLREQFDEPNVPDAEARITVNFQPVGYRGLKPPIIPMRPGTREFWRVANGTAGRFATLTVQAGGIAQPLDVVAFDGIPAAQPQHRAGVDLPPGGRAEFIVSAPDAGQDGAVIETDAEGGDDHPRVIAHIEVTPNAAALPPLASDASQQVPAAPATGFDMSAHVAAHRSLYFAEAMNGTKGPTRYFLAVNGAEPRSFDAAQPPAIVATAGTMEMWEVENRSRENHAFHMPGVRFLFLAAGGRPLRPPEWHDVVTVPAWRGQGPYPSATLLMDFRGAHAMGARAAGCRILRHADSGMMLPVRIKPPSVAR